MKIKLNNEYVSSIGSLFVNEEIIIGIDSSKRNTGITVMKAGSDEPDIIEFEGRDVGTTELDTLLMCQEQRKVLYEIFRDSKPIIVGIENIITKRSDDYESGSNSKSKKGVKNERKETGMTIHSSRFKITAVFMSIISFFQDTFNITPKLVNNWDWKVGILPAEYRKRTHHKGSLDWLQDIGSYLGAYTDDATDSYCICLFLKKTATVKLGERVREREMCRYNYEYMYVDTETVLKRNLRTFIYNPDFTVQENLVYMSNHLGMVDNVLGVMDIPIEILPFSDIYKNAKGKFREYVKEVRVVLANKRGT